MRLADALKTGVTSWRDVHAALVLHNEPGNPTAGYLFEEFAKHFFLAAPEYKGEFKNVWAEAEIPSRIRKKLTLATRDHGVDLLLEDHEGRFHAVQCKFKTDESKILSWTKDRLSSWLAESDEAQGLVMFTNASGIDPQSTRKAAKKDFTLITVGDLVSLSPETIENIARLARGRAQKKTKRLKPYPHQRRAINDVVKGFKTHDRGQLILPCGAGKTLAALWLKERLGAKRTLVLVPSLALLRQIRREWAAQQKERLPYLCVCSEKDIDKDKRDVIVTHSFEVPGHVTTQPNEIAAFARKHRELVVYSTYQSLEAVVDAGVKFDLAICDEAHKTATARHNEFALVHDDALKAEKRLYMTATPRVLSYQAKAKLGDDPFSTVADMSDEETFGPEFHRMGFGEAIDEGILSDYKIVVVGVNDRQVHKHIEQRTYLEDASADQVATSLALQKAMKKHGAAHALTFHSSIRRAKAFKDIHGRRVRSAEVEHVNGSMSTNDRLMLLDEFRDAPHAVLTNARCLTEGVDVPAIDCVAFVDPRHSKVDIVQAAGRALRIGDGTKAYGVILIPLFYQVGEDPEVIASSGVFKNVFEVVRAMADQDERLQAEVLRIKLGEGEKPVVHSRVDIDIDDDRVVLIGFEKQLREALFERIVERSVSTVDVRVAALRQFFEEHGHWNVPQSGTTKELGAWCSHVRSLKRKGRIWDSLRQALDAIGFDWQDWIEGLDSDELAKRLGVSRAFIKRYRNSGGAVEPIGWNGQSPVYSVDAANRIRDEFGVTLTSTDGLVSLVELAKLAKVGRMTCRTLRKQGRLQPAGIGFGPGPGGVREYFRPAQAQEISEMLGNEAPEGSLSTKEFAEIFDVSDTTVREWMSKGVVPRNQARGNYFFTVEDVSRVKKALGVITVQERERDGLVSLAEVATKLGLTEDAIKKRIAVGTMKPAAQSYLVSSKTYWFRQDDEFPSFEELSKKRYYGNAKLNDAQVWAIYRAPGTYAHIAQEYGVSTLTVGNIKRGKTWAHVTGHKTGAA